MMSLLTMAALGQAGVLKTYTSCCPPPFTKGGDIKTHSSVRLSVCHKNFNLAQIFWIINDRALIFGMHEPCDKSFALVLCGELYLDLLLNSRSNLLPGGGPQFFEFACYNTFVLFVVKIFYEAMRNFGTSLYFSVCFYHCQCDCLVITLFCHSYLRQRSEQLTSVIF